MLETARRKVEKLLYGPRIELNAMISARLEGTTSLSLHIYPAEAREKQYAIGETRQGWRDALYVLAQKCRNDPAFKNVETITATSWYVRALGPMFEELGFEVDYDNKDQSGRFFLKRYSIAHAFDKRPRKYVGVKLCFAKISRSKLCEQYPEQLAINNSSQV